MIVLRFVQGTLPAAFMGSICLVMDAFCVTMRRGIAEEQSRMGSVIEDFGIIHLQILEVYTDRKSVV